MRLPVEISIAQSGRFARGLIALSLAGSLAACGMMGGGRPVNGGLVAAAGLPANGPQSDYPVLVGEPYQIGEQSYRPNDSMNYDEVGYLAVDSGAMGVTGSHHTLPVPSYAEVTSLTTGRTILVRLERRGPMESNHLLALSPAALAQLDATAETPVRVRRVNPPEEQRALLRGGQSASLRMDTPMALVSVLRRRLPAAPGAAEPSVVAPIEMVAAAPAPAAEPQPSGRETQLSGRETVASAAVPPSEQEPTPPLAGAAAAPASASSPVIQTVPTAAPVAQASGNFMVQAATFSTEERAARAAATLGGVVTPSGNLLRVRTGPFATRNAAEASLANVRAAGYSDARILTGG